jgi:transposase-like protein
LVCSRNAKAAKRLMRKLLKSQGRAPRVMITDKLRSYVAAKREIMPGVEHRSHKGLTNRAENSHQPIRRRERIMKHPKGVLGGTRAKDSSSFSQGPESQTRKIDRLLCEHDVKLLLAVG